jgi:pimeloyl-ACP methyl ester carboxylesterase
MQWMSRLLLLGLAVAAAGACARPMLRLACPPLPLDAVHLSGVVEEQIGEALLLRPAGRPVEGSVVFLHGFAGAPEMHGRALRALARRGYAVWAPLLPDYFALRPLYSSDLRREALRLFDEGAAGLASRGLPPPALVGYSLGGGAAVAVAEARRVPAVLWAPIALEGPVPEASSPLLVLAGERDCLVRRRPLVLARALALRTRVGTPRVRVAWVRGGNHLGFLDGACVNAVDCLTPVSPDAQRSEVVSLTAAFLGRHAARAVSAVAARTGADGEGLLLAATSPRWSAEEVGLPAEDVPGAAKDLAPQASDVSCAVQGVERPG